MNRIFHVRMDSLSYLLLAILSVNAVYALWCKYIFLAVVWMLGLILVIERIINSTYTITADNKLIVSKGRFTPKQIVPIEQIMLVEKRCAIRLGSISLMHYLLIIYDKDRHTAVFPVKEEEFFELLEKKMGKRDQ